MSDLGTTPAFYSSQPEIFLEGARNAGLSTGVISLMVEETTEGLARCEATFGNWGEAEGSTGFLYFKRDILDFGKSFSVRLGEGAAAGQVFDGRIMALEARYPKMRPPEITLLAEDRLQDLRMRRRTRTFEDMTDAEVFKQIAADHSLQPDIDVNGPTHKVLAQVNQSDLAFLRERARAIDAEVWIEASKLRAKMRSRRETNTVTLTHGQGLEELVICADLANQQTTVAVSGWDVKAKAAILHQATATVLGSELNGDLSGSRILQEALGERTQVLAHATPLTSAEARAVAEANFRRCARRFVTGRALAQGDGRLHVGTHVTLQGVGDLFAGEYYVNEVRHLFDRTSGYQCDFQVERTGFKPG